MVVADRTITSAIDFWSVSVTAEKLIRMLQVPPHLLAAWLVSRRAEGYTCVGCEQTVRLVKELLPANVRIKTGSKRILDACGGG